MLIYEAPLLRNITSRGAPLTLICGSDVRQSLALSRRAFIDFALLLGTDFSQRIRNVGPARALRFIREHGSIEGVLEKEQGFPPRESTPVYLAHVALGREVYETLPPMPKDEELRGREVDEDAVAKVLMKYDLQREVAEDYAFANALAGNYFKDDPHS